MAITHTQLKGSGDGRDAIDRTGSGQLKYLVRGSNSLAAVDAYVEANNLFPALAIFGTREMVYKDADWEQRAFGVFEYTGNYVEPDRAEKERRLDAGETKLSFDTSSGTHRVTVGLVTRKFPAEAPDLGDYIEVNEDGIPEGVDIVIPALRMTLTHRFDKADIDAEYVKTLARLTGTVNENEFYGFEPGELLFLGASGNLSTITDPEIQFNFLASENVDGLTFGAITGVGKAGHDYLWVRSHTVKANETSMIQSVPRPYAVYVSSVYPAADWTALGIGTDA